MKEHCAVLVQGYNKILQLCVETMKYDICVVLHKFAGRWNLILWNWSLQGQILDLEVPAPLTANQPWCTPDSQACMSKMGSTKNFKQMANRKKCSTDQLKILMQIQLQLPHFRHLPEVKIKITD